MTDSKSRSNLGLVSVVIPTHGRVSMLKRALRSVLDQSYRDVEIIVASDGLSKETEDAVASFKEPNVVYLERPLPKGASAARNLGIRAAKGEYLAFLDDDDEWLPRKLERQVELMMNSGEQVGLIYSWERLVQDGKEIGRKCPEVRGDIFVEMLGRQVITNSSNLLIRRSVLERVPGFDEDLPLGNDGDFIRRITQHFEVDYVPEMLTVLNVGHADRLSVNHHYGLEYRLHANRVRLRKFAREYVNYPDKHCDVMLQNARLCWKLIRPFEAVAWVARAWGRAPTAGYFCAACRPYLRRALTHESQDGQAEGPEK